MDTQRVAFLAVSSTSDPRNASAEHNPADFQITVPNAIKLTGVTRVTYTTISVPRMFPTITPNNNRLEWYQRQVMEVPTETKDYWLRTVSPNWTLVKSMTITPGILNMTEILAQINAVSGPNEVWSYDSIKRTIVIVKTPTDPPITFGIFFDPGHVTPPVSYANMTYIGQGSSTLFDTIGLQKAADAEIQTLDTIPFSPENPNTFDTLRGSNLENRFVVHLFDRFAHNYTTWATTPFTTETFNPPNISGPTTVHVTLSDLMDTSTINAGTGIAYDVLSTLNIDTVDIGRYYTKVVRDGEAEGIGLVAPRAITAFKIQLRDEKFQILRLPRNYPVSLSLQIFYTSR